jgi:hypothetical protein
MRHFYVVTARDNQVTVEGWIKFALLPGVFVGEMGVGGFFGFAIKTILKTYIQRLEASLR